MIEPLSTWIDEARRRTLDLVADLTDEQLMGPMLSIINPLRWEIGHVAWFQERWVLRHARGERPLRVDGDRLYDSSAIPHDSRWDLPLPSRQETLAYMAEVNARVLDGLPRGVPNARERYFVLLATFHEDMHDEAFAYTRQTLAFPRPIFSDVLRTEGSRERGPLLGDVEVPGGMFSLGALDDGTFVFDNEKWAHPVEVKPFRIAKAPVTQREFQAFVEDGGYERADLWSEEGRRWLRDTRAQQPVYWRRDTRRGAWLRRHFDTWVPLEPYHPVIHVCYFEADAYCRWAKRRLPTEVEWEVTASGVPDGTGRRLAPQKRRYPWGEDPPSPDHANLDAREIGCADVVAFPRGDSAFGARQMLGNVWEWTSSDFAPYPGFAVDPYKEYSEPWFGTHKVLRGGCWVTRSRLIRNTWRNFYRPDRRDVWAGFRTCCMSSDERGHRA